MGMMENETWIAPFRGGGGLFGSGAVFVSARGLLREKTPQQGGSVFWPRTSRKHDCKGGG
jgi:hypothetical protein